MAAAVVYDGTGSGGMLFDGKKFWVAQRVPSRSRWLDLITANGGQIVPLEKLADIMIADHARKDAVPGSYSWTWIEQSVKKGILEDLEAHRAGPLTGTSRPIGSSQPIRNARTAFTAADDRALALWVTNAEKQGISTKGNVIYQQLERINPRHTFQSWRDRWVKYGQFQPRPEVAASPTAPGPVIERPSMTRIKSLSNGSTKQATASATTDPTPRPRPQSRSVTPPIRPSNGNPFTEDDCKTLMDIYDDILNIDETRLIEAWEKFAEHNPRHTAQEWYKFWMDDVKPLRASGRRKSTKRKPQVPTFSSQRGESSQALETSVNDVSAQPISGRKPQSRHESFKRLYTEKERFEHTFTEFAEGQNMEVDLRPTVGGRTIQMFDLWTIVKDPEFNKSANDEASDKWDQISLKLGFKNLGDSNAPNELRELYDWILADFADVRSQYRAYLKYLLDNEGELTEEQALDFEYLTPPGYEEEDKVARQKLAEECVDEPEILEIPSSPPKRIWLSSAKHVHSVTAEPSNETKSSQQLEVTPYKRQRVDKGKGKVLEIPSTPEDLLKFDGQVRGLPQGRGQDLVQGVEEEADLSEEEEGMFVKPVQRKMFSNNRIQASKPVQFEPETQDFQFSNVVDEGNEATPSQQIEEDVMAAGESVAAVAGSLPGDSSTQSQTDSQREAAEIQELVDHYIALGYPENVVQEAMLATTLETGDVATVMEAIMQGRGIPGNVEGVWTAEDDHAVRLNEDDEEYARVVRKHTEARCVKRRQLLSQTQVPEDL